MGNITTRKWIGASLFLALTTACGVNDPASFAKSDPDTIATAVPEPTPQVPEVLRSQIAPIRVAPNAPNRLRAYYAATERRLLREGKLRRDDQDIPLTARGLTRDFIAIALRDEYAFVDGQITAQNQPAALRRWDQNLSWKLHLGRNVATDQGQTVSGEIDAYMRRLSRLSGLDIIRTNAAQAQVHIFFLDSTELAQSAPILQDVLAGTGRETIELLTNLNQDTYCAVAALSAPNRYTYERAAVVIRAEHPDLFRLSCIHEELAQALGLANDSPEARPSIFNDDEEFALLTQHDAYLLQILYDPRLKPGMKAAEAEPIVLRIATELLAGDISQQKGEPDGHS